MSRSAHTSATIMSSLCASSGHLYSHPLLFSNVRLPPPSAMYAMSVHGAPQNPMRGTRPSRPSRVSRIASNK